MVRGGVGLHSHQREAGAQAAAVGVKELGQQVGEARPPHAAQHHHVRAAAAAGERAVPRVALRHQRAQKRGLNGDQHERQQHRQHHQHARQVRGGRDVAIAHRGQRDDHEVGAAAPGQLLGLLHRRGAHEQQRQQRHEDQRHLTPHRYARAHAHAHAPASQYKASMHASEGEEALTVGDEAERAQEEQHAERQRGHQHALHGQRGVIGQHRQQQDG